VKKTAEEATTSGRAAVAEVAATGGSRGSGAAGKRAASGKAAKVVPAKEAAVKEAAAKGRPAAKEAVTKGKPAAKGGATKSATAKTTPAKTAAAKAPEKAAKAAKAPAKAAKAPAKAAKAQPDKVAPGRLATRPDEDPWTDEELAEVRAELEGQARELRGEISDAEQMWAEQLRDSGEGAGDDQADAGTKTFEREHELSLASNTRELLAQVERALMRIDTGTYGICENCGNPIGKARLQAFPRATLCVSCKQREERR
jgi:RNA polymerase-binding protein DksA